MATMPDKPQQPAEGALIQRAMIRQRLSARQAATKAAMSEGRWRQIVAGYQSARGQHIPVTAPPATLARMAQAVGLTPDDLTTAGRADAADVLRDLATAQPGPAQSTPASRSEALTKVMRSDKLTDDQKRRIVELLIAEQAAFDRQIAERAEQLIHLVQGEN